MHSGTMPAHAVANTMTASLAMGGTLTVVLNHTKN